MEKEKYTYKDFSAASLNINLKDRVKEFQKYIKQSVENDHEIYWIEANSGLGPEIEFENKETGNIIKKYLSFPMIIWECLNVRKLLMLGLKH